MPEEPIQKRYNQEEVNAILRRAIDRHGPAGSISHQDLLETARELGIEPSELEAAVAEQETVGVMESAREEWKLRRRQKFSEHLRSYLVVNGVLLILNLATGPESLWFLWPMFGWGIGIIFDAADTFWPKDKAIERGAQRLLEKRARDQRREQRSGIRGLQIGSSSGRKSVVIDGKAGKIIIEKGKKRIEIG